MSIVQLDTSSASRVVIQRTWGSNYSVYVPFGELFIEERNSWNTPYKFSGKELDDETGYNYFGARYYDPNISIWLSVDPLSDKYPRYTPYNYTLNNPVKYTDPNGEFPILGTLVGAATGAIGEITSQTISYGLNRASSKKHRQPL